MHTLIYLEGSQNTQVEKQGNETGKGKRSMKSVLFSKLPAVGTCGELWERAGGVLSLTGKDKEVCTQHVASSVG